jgi:hypothetical protein
MIRVEQPLPQQLRIGLNKHQAETGGVDVTTGSTMGVDLDPIPCTAYRPKKSHWS